MKSRKSQLSKSGFILGLAPLARIQRNPLNARIFDKGKLERAMEHILIHELPLSIFIDETDLILSGYENFKAAEALELDEVVTKRSILPLPVCTENLDTGVVVMESAQDGA